MLNKSVIILFLGIILCHKIYAQLCQDRELGPPQNFQARVNEVLFLNWLPPAGFESCAVTYSLHIQNMNTSEYLTPIVHLGGFNYIFDYDKYCKTCLHMRAVLFAHNSGRTSPFSTLVAFLTPVVPQGPPTSLFLNRTETALGIYWSLPEGFENCGRFFSNFLTIMSRETGQFTISFPMSGASNSFYFSYPPGHPLVCQEVDVEVAISFTAATTITGTTIFGPPGLC
ncbi:uncharacterized protein [Onthophagus taurus]|uniref:uncharacterized protein n=1 Tax=Onthophagus taurus TaxID=166361 RepID=UPI0039BDBD68